ncbi:MAG: ABC transporter ATP-binding protein [Candidatus Brocadiia bacterium]
MAEVEVKHLYVRYGKTTAVRDLSFRIPEGEVFGFIGPNGAGKTTTIRVLATLLKPAAGTALVGGHDVMESPRRVRRIIGYMPDFFGVYDDLNVREYLHFFAAAYRLNGAERRRVIGDVLELTDLTDKRDEPVDSLSRGMKQRLGLARVLLHDPKVLLLDEPASGLDPRARIEIRELLKEMKRMGKTILVSSHILHELAQLCTCIGIIEAGGLVAEGSLDDIYRQLGLRRIIHVQISNATEEMMRRAEQIDGVASVERHVDRFCFQIREHRLGAEELLEALRNLGARVYMFQPEAMDMETAFMKLTEGKLA